ncbi:PREDICTED: eukaryotic translation initiation factor 3 subunit A-like [Habropoda laboriosa]|uniref:eukaryotic translation initiation factor 3 subunit A-like n=1 Tax=Habropoda laboriosa TaxID=597456 RepID=UPI00083D9F22|nr:PREDICTED: eukaryotic translation initiation factor 3 subunit A-like [Habropoda laboriosa]
MSKQLQTTKERREASSAGAVTSSSIARTSKLEIIQLDAERNEGFAEQELFRTPSTREAARNTARRGSRSASISSRSSDTSCNTRRSIFSDSSEDDDFVAPTGESAGGKRRKEHHSPGGKIKRGRPITSGEFKDRAKEIERYNLAKERQLELRQQLDLFNPSAPAPALPAKWLLIQEEKIEEAKNLPTADLQAQLTSACDGIVKVVSTSSNLKGTYQQVLRNAAILFRAFAGELGTRTVATAPAAKLEEENAALRRKVDELAAKVDTLTEAVAVQGRKSEGRSCQSKGVDAPSTTTRESLENVTAAMNSMVVEEPQLEQRRLRDRVPMKRRAVESSTENSAEEAMPPPRPAKVVAAPPAEQDREDRLIRLMAEIVERKLDNFREELFHGKTVRPPLGVKPTQEKKKAKAGTTRERPEAAKKRRTNEERKKEETADARQSTPEKNPAPPPQENTWAKVVGRKEARALKAAAKQPQKQQQQPTGAAQQPKPRLARAPRTAAVTRSDGEYGPRSHGTGKRGEGGGATSKDDGGAPGERHKSRLPNEEGGD